MTDIFHSVNNHSKPFNSNKSPRSCANPSIFHDILPPSYYNNFGNQECDDADVDGTEMNNGLRNVSYEDDSMEMDEESPAEVAMLLTSVADIVTKEIKADPPIMNALADAFPRFPYISSATLPLSTETTTEEMEVELDQYPKKVPSPPPPPAAAKSLMHFDHKKSRSVSMDSPELRANKSSPWVPSPSPAPHQEEATTTTTTPALLQWRDLRGKSTSPPHFHGIFSTPPPSPYSTSSSKHHHHHPGVLHPTTMTPNPIGRSPNVYLSPRSSRQSNNRPRSISLAEATKVPDLDLTTTAPPANNNTNNSAAATTVKEVILRKKFSWKNYPQLEEFLIANREEYLRHSTLNYTLQQKKYNNCLTLRMIMLAAEHGYVFDETDFNFVTVRDRIRCYYKSYVQSMKKRGLVIGYAARKAGLVTEEELEESAHTSGKIYVPKN